MTIRNISALLLILLSFCCLYPGLVYDTLNISISVKLPILGNRELHNETLSIIGTIRRLFDEGNTLVAFLILLFSVIIPLIKGIGLLVALLFTNNALSKRLHKIIGTISKWSMADVFIVGIFLAFLSTKSNEQINAELHEGFYFFTAYCILSILAAQIMKLPKQIEAD